MTEEDVRKHVESADVELPGDNPQARPLLLDVRDPLNSSREFITTRYTRRGERTLHHQAGAFFTWSGTCYPQADDAAIRAELYKFLETALRRDAKTGMEVPFQPTMHRVNNVLDALRAVANVPNTINPPAWLEHTPDLPPDEILACANGLLHLPTRQLLPPSPIFFSHNAVDFAYDPHAPAPEGWGRFLDDLWPHDLQAKETLQDLFGYFLTSDTRQQKIALIVGPKRSGKGTMARVLTKVLGQANVCAPTLASLGQNFGLAPLISKQLAVMSDARLGGRTDQHAIAERLLSISGEDALTIDRKYRDPWTGKLSCRFLILTNELPRIADASGALASRFIVLTLNKSFYDREDHGLYDRLVQDLPGILNWGIEGWQRLQERGYFVQPASSAELMEDLEDLSSPTGAFIRRRCVVESSAEVACNVLYTDWKDWCDSEGRTHPGTAQTFGRDLRAVIPGLRTKNRRQGDGSRCRCYIGVGLKD